MQQDCQKSWDDLTLDSRWFSYDVIQCLDNTLHEVSVHLGVFETGGDRLDRGLFTKGPKTYGGLFKLCALLSVMCGFLKGIGCGGEKDKNFFFFSGMRPLEFQERLNLREETIWHNELDPVVSS